MLWRLEFSRFGSCLLVTTKALWLLWRISRLWSRLLSRLVVQAVVQAVVVEEELPQCTWVLCGSELKHNQWGI